VLLFPAREDGQSTPSQNRIIPPVG
jgi:hypothetical protein